MTLILSNEEIDDLLEMDELIPVLEDAYRELAEGRGATRRRSDIVTPTTLRDDGLYALKSMDGVIPKLGVGAIRLNSDILTCPRSGNEMRRVKAPAAPGNRYVGLVLLFSTHTGEPLAIMPDGVMQRARVGATNGIAAKYLAREDANVLAVLGSGWQAGAQVTAHDAVRDLTDIRVYSPNRKNREAFAEEMSEVIGKEVRACDSGEEACRGPIWWHARPTQLCRCSRATGWNPACISAPSGPARPRWTRARGTASTCSRCSITTTTRS